MTRVLIVDDHKMILDGIKSIFRYENKIKVVAEAENGKKALEILDNQAVDLILLDVNMPEMDGLETCKRVKEKYPEIKILALTMHNQESFLSQMLENGASGYILKNTGKKELLKAIKTVMDGKSYFSEEAVKKLMSSLQNNSSRKNKIEIPKISRREKEVLYLIAQEYTTQEIAEELNISLNTVESHRSNLLAKLKVRNAAGLVRVAMELKII